jgi:hypothetical protein
MPWAILQFVGEVPGKMMDVIDSLSRCYHPLSIREVEWILKWHQVQGNFYPQIVWLIKRQRWHSLYWSERNSLQEHLCLHCQLMLKWYSTTCRVCRDFQFVVKQWSEVIKMNPYGKWCLHLICINRSWLLLIISVGDRIYMGSYQLFPLLIGFLLPGLWVISFILLLFFYWFQQICSNY